MSGRAGGYVWQDGYVQEVGIPGPLVYLPQPVPTPSGGHQNRDGWQAGGAHLLECFLVTVRNVVTAR